MLLACIWLHVRYSSCIDSDIKLVKLWGPRALMRWMEGKGQKLAVRLRYFSLTGAAEAPKSETQARLDVKWKEDLTDWPELASRGRERGGFRVRRASLSALPSSELWKGRGHMDVFSPLLLHRHFINEINYDWLEMAGGLPTGETAINGPRSSSRSSVRACCWHLYERVFPGSNCSQCTQGLFTSESFKLTDESLMDMMGARWLHGVRYR